MKKTLHYLLMANHLMFHKALLLRIKDIELTPGQPKVLEYLMYHDGAVQKEIAGFCHIEPATITSVLAGMEKNGLIVRKNLNGNRRSLYVYLTEKGRLLAGQTGEYFKEIESMALSGFDEKETKLLVSLLTRMNDNMHGKEEMNYEKN